MIIVGIVFWISMTVVNCMIASEKHRDVVGVAIGSILLSPLIIYLYLLAVPTKSVEGQQAKDAFW